MKLISLWHRAIELLSLSRGMEWVTLVVLVLIHVRLFWFESLIIRTYRSTLTSLMVDDIIMSL